MNQENISTNNQVLYHLNGYTIFETEMRDRYIAAAEEKDSFWRAAKKPIVSDKELR